MHDQLIQHGWKGKEEDGVYTHPDHPGHRIETIGGKDPGWMHTTRRGDRSGVNYPVREPSELSDHLWNFGKAAVGTDFARVEALIEKAPPDELLRLRGFNAQIPPR
jgi:hypothetical protein